MLAGGVPLLLAFVLLAASQSVPTFDLLALLAVPLPHSTQYARFPALPDRLRRQGAAGAAAYLAAAVRAGRAGVADRAAGRAQTWRLRAGALRHSAGARRCAGPALAARRPRHGDPALRRGRRSGAEQPARCAGLCQHLPRRPGRARPRGVHRAGCAGGGVPAAQLLGRPPAVPSCSSNFCASAPGRPTSTAWVARRKPCRCWPAAS